MSTFKSVKDLVKEIAPGSIDQFENLLRSTQVVRCLVQGRISAGLTQRDIAAKMELSQSAISKLERSLDCDLTLGEVARYAAACEKTYTVRVGAPVSLTQCVKNHAFGLKRDLEKLVEIARSNEDDSIIPKEVTRFFGEAWFNLGTILMEASSKLPPSTANAKVPMLRMLDDEIGFEPRSQIQGTPSTDCAVSA